MTSSGHFFSTWANFRGHFLRVNSHGHFLVNSGGHVCSREVLFLVSQHRGYGGKAPSRLIKHLSVPGKIRLGKVGLGWVRLG